MESSDFFIKLKFRDTQLLAIKEIYDKYFAPKIIEEYAGKAFICIWDPAAKWKPGQKHDKNHNHLGYVVPECNDDPLWNEFLDILPYMAMSASLTKMPANAVMSPHVDRKWRPNAIYFPISGCTEQCVSKVYDYPLPNSENSISMNLSDHIFEYSIVDNAVLTNPHLWHGVENFSNVERIAFGWNFKPAGHSFEQCKQLLQDLGYL